MTPNNTHAVAPDTAPRVPTHAATALKRARAMRKAIAPIRLATALIVLLALASCTAQSLQTTYNNQETKIDTYADAVNFIECELTVNSSTGNYAMEKIDTIAPRITRNGGATRLTVIEGDGDQLTSNGSVTFRFAGYVFTSGPSTIQMAYLTITGSDGLSDSSWLFSTPYTSINVSGDVTSGATISGSGSSSGLTLFGTDHYLTAQFAGWDLSESEYEAMTLSLKDKTVLEGLRDGLEGVRAGEVCDIAFCAKYGLGKKVLGTIPANSALLYRVWVDSVNN